MDEDIPGHVHTEGHLGTVQCRDVHCLFLAALEVAGWSLVRVATTAGVDVHDEPRALPSLKPLAVQGDLDSWRPNVELEAIPWQFGGFQEQSSVEEAWLINRNRLPLDFGQSRYWVVRDLQTQGPTCDPRGDVDFIGYGIKNKAVENWDSHDRRGEQHQNRDPWTSIGSMQSSDSYRGLFTFGVTAWTSINSGSRGRTRLSASS